MKKDNLKIGDYVFLEVKPGQFSRSYDVQMGAIYQIRSVEAMYDPPLYTLFDLLGDLKLG